MKMLSTTGDPHLGGHWATSQGVVIWTRWRFQLLEISTFGGASLHFKFIFFRMKTYTSKFYAAGMVDKACHFSSKKNKVGKIVTELLACVAVRCHSLNRFLSVAVCAEKDLIMFRQSVQVQ